MYVGVLLIDQNNNQPIPRTFIPLLHLLPIANWYSNWKSNDGIS